MNKTEEYRKLALEFAQAKVIPQFGDDRAYFIAVSGSVGYGFADERSDIELEVYSRQIYKYPVVKSIVQNEKEFRGVELSSGLTMWPVEDILAGKYAISTDHNPNLYFEMSNSFCLLDPLNMFADMQAKLGFFSDEDKLRVIRGLYLQLTELGYHIADKAAGRDKKFEANLGLYSSLEALIRLVHILNNEFFPHTKWLTSTLATLENQYDVDTLLAEIGGSADVRANVDRFKAFMDKFQRSVLLEGQYLTEEEVFNPWSMMSDPSSYVFYPTLAKY